MLSILDSVAPFVPPSDLRIALSGITGSVSFACWIVLLIPQLIEQWKLKSADGISLGTVLIWVTGDLANLVGAIWAGLLPPVILLAVWFLIIDGSLLTSYIYYTHIFPKRHKIIHTHHSEEATENTTLLATSENENAHGTQQTNGRKSSTKSRRDSLTSLAVASSHWSAFQKYVLPMAFVSMAGVVGYLLSSSPSAPPDGELPTLPNDELTFGAQFFGYFSALCYLGARIPQILYNYQRKSCHGLSLLFILFSTFGNLTYSLQILFYRSDADYVILNLPWLIGSLGAIVEDSAIYVQFIIYRDNAGNDDLVEAVEDVIQEV
ncbi:hypothetical protein DASC09_057820 [Saccharomycopsis crataegensis]|uniref:Vacuolar membrane PQ loop repeat protein n=1 Tax=Saccharomycopsis crataegensis TaxID=43959 RepID=A0AAV5QWF2_9ASCO|nr:hypothetical protein DASC09_057820 [Saccharomycopsis crataegensis]